MSAFLCDTDRVPTVHGGALDGLSFRVCNKCLRRRHQSQFRMVSTGKRNDLCMFCDGSSLDASANSRNRNPKGEAGSPAKHSESSEISRGDSIRPFMSTLGGSQKTTPTSAVAPTKAQHEVSTGAVRILCPICNQLGDRHKGTCIPCAQLLTGPERTEMWQAWKKVRDNTNGSVTSAGARKEFVVLVRRYQARLQVNQGGRQDG